MSVILIDEAGLREAAAKFRNHNADGSYLSIEERLSAAVSAYLSAIGATRELRGRLPFGDSVPDPREERIVTPWRPLTTTEEER